MSMYDSVAVKCPVCKKSIEFQSKAGKCTLNKYPLYDVPVSIAEDIDGREITCSCGRVLHMINPKPDVRIGMHVEINGYIFHTLT